MARELWARLQLKYIYAWQAGVSGSSNTPLVSRRSSRRRTGSTRLNARHEAVRRTRQCACAPRSAPRVQVPASDSNQSHTLQYGESENTGKLTGSRMTLIERGLGAQLVSSKSHANARSTSCRLARACMLISSSSGSILGAHRLCRRLRRGTRG